MDTSKWKSQLRKGTLEYGLLHLIHSRKSLYGLNILKALCQEGMEITEGTLYPLLSRLSQEGLIKSKWNMEQSGGHPRKYYEITARGVTLLTEMDKEWLQLVQAIKDLKGE